ncbi:MAG TPA: polysaccharide biosynthesis/export family protein, partial [Methylomirabilota bacterium]|nr:polysaccharide biosynthesis/export family protein [Methylomirabilota bacterium]
LSLLCAAVGVAYAGFTRTFSASLQLFAYERTFANQAEAADFAASARSTGSLAKVVAKLPRNVSTEDLAERCRVTVDQGQPFIGVTVVAENINSARALVDVFAKQVATTAEEWVSKRTREVDRQITAAQRRLRDLRKQFGDFDDALLFGDVRSLRQTLSKDASERATAVTSLRNQLTSINAEEKKIITQLAADKPVLRSLQQELEQALTRYTDEHPRVKELRASIIALQKESGSKTSSGKSSATKTNGQLAELNIKRTAVRDQLKKAEASELKSRQALEKFATNEVEFVRLQSEYNALGTRRDELIQSRVLVGSKGVEKWRRSDRIETARITDVPRIRNHGIAGALLGLGLGSISYSVTRRKNRIVRNAAALEEASGLPVLATLPDLTGMSDSARRYWAVETLQSLRNTARVQRRGCFVCGIISASNGEGRSTWIELLSEAGLQNGNRVLVVSRPDFVALENAAEVPPNTLFVPHSTTDSSGADSRGIARYTLVADIANISLQKHWERAFTTWQNEENALVLVELPPAMTADALLLSSAVPNLLWLSAENMAEARNVSRCVGSLRNGGCHLIGAGLNFCSSAGRVAAWVLLLALTVATPGLAQEPKPVTPAAVTNGQSLVVTNGLSASKGPMLAPWQEKLTLGAGDVFQISLYGQADSTRDVVVGPDGQFSYLQALDVKATGLTVDELRGHLETTLMKFHLAPRVVLIPGSFQSKRYYILGNVVGRGAHLLDKPTTVVEAIAKAKGFVTAGAQRSSFTLTDFSQAFLARRQADGSFVREPVDFEALFQRGDLENNKLLAPEDYLYFPPTALQEVYVLGEVRGAGQVPYTKNLGVIGAIAGRGGFTDGAYKQRILVIRGSLQRPETFVVDISKILLGTSKDFVLQPKDIVYVSRKPWAKAEELLEAASSDFVRAFVVTWTGQQIVPPIFK